MTGPGRPARATTGVPALTLLELLAVWTVGLALIGAGWVWATAQLSTLLSRGHGLALRPNGALRVLGALARRPDHPAAAFPAELAGQIAHPTVFWTVGALLIGAVATPAVWWQARRNAHDEDEARWATVRDLAPLVVRHPVPGRLTLGHGPARKLLAAEPAHSLLVMGPTQSGKTSGLAIPAILEWPGPVVATSVKSDLLRDTIEARRQRGEVWVFDPSGSVPDEVTSTWSPLAGCGTWRGALRTANWMSQAARDRQLGENDFWYANAAKLIAPLLFAAHTAELTITDVVRWVDIQDTDEVAVLLNLAGVPEAMAAATATWQRDPRTRSSVYTTAETVLAAYADPQVAATAESSDIDPARLLDGSARTLYVSAPMHEQARLRPLFTALVQTILAAGYEHAATHGRLDPPLLLVLDEAANIAPVRDLGQIASTAAGLGVQLVTIWQDRAQIVHRYGDAATTVVNNHRAKLLLSGITDNTTTQELAQLIGETRVTRRSTTIDPEGRTSATHAHHNRPLTSSAGLRQLQPFEGVLIYGHLPPTRLRLRPWFTTRRLRTRRRDPSHRPRRPQPEPD